MHLDSPDTLSHYLDIPHRERIPVGQWYSTEEVAKALASHLKDADLAFPNYEAVEFYALNQLVSRLQQVYTPNEKLPNWAVNVAAEYQDCLSRQCLRIFHYLLAIVTRESRHLTSKHTVLTTGVGKDFPQEMKDFLFSLHSQSSDGAVQLLKECDLKVPVVDFVKMIETIFNKAKGHFPSSYGGEKWGAIATPLYRYLAGDLSAEMLLDTSFTLAHNTGAIFNKGMLYKKETGYLINLLDVQRSGQIVQLLLDSCSDHPYFHNIDMSRLANLKTLVSPAANNLEIPVYVDWYKVEELGAVQKYSLYKSKQDKAHPKSTPQVVQPIAQPEKPKALVDSNGTPIELVGKFEVFPGIAVNTYQRKNGVVA